jgi:hypothetical protein
MKLKIEQDKKSRINKNKNQTNIKNNIKNKTNIKDKINLKNIIIITKILFLILLITFILQIILKSPSNDREWNEDQKILSNVKFHTDNKELITIYNIRNISYQNETEFNISYYDKTVNISNLQTLDYILERFSDHEGIAHTMLTFGFKDNSQIAISIEIRKEIGESYSPLKGLFNEYETMYVIGDETDLINLRTNHRNDSTFLYPIKISNKSLKKLFVAMLEKTDQLYNYPEFYNTLTSTCTTELAVFVNSETKETINKYNFKVLLPGYSDKLLLEKKLINTNLTIDEYDKLREQFEINTISKRYINSPNYHLGIRNKLE